MSAWMLKTYLTMKNKWDSFKETEDGMETVQAIILIVVGLVIVAGLVTLIGKDSSSGLLKAIKDKLTEIGINI